MKRRSILDGLYSGKSLKNKLDEILLYVQENHCSVARIAVAIHDDKTGYLKTYIHSGAESPLYNYQADLQASLSLQAIKNERIPRVVNDMESAFDGMNREHTARIATAGFQSSYTLPVFHNDRFYGFIFFNSDEKNTFEGDILHFLDMAAHIISLMVVMEIQTARILIGAIASAACISNAHDPETGNHLYRMARYSRLIASELAEEYSLTDDYIEHLFMFAPMHDIGKIAIPEHILKKPGKLTELEKIIMQGHTQKGREIIDRMVESFQLDALEHINVLKNIAEYHHETVSGTGYPTGKSGGDIPLEARIVAVADVFDALTTRRVYKDAWSFDEAFTFLKKVAGEQLDQDCVEALIRRRDDVHEIYSGFGDDNMLDGIQV